MAARRPPLIASRWQLAWATLTGAFALHVLDEATHDFLAWYNPQAVALRARLGGAPFPPSFTFGVWLAGLATAIAVLGALTPLVRPGRRWAVAAGYVYAVIHVLNALGHLSVSLAGWGRAPGVLSSPMLLAAAVWLLVETRRAQTAARHGERGRASMAADGR